MSDKLRGEMFWTDRWLSSSAFLLPIEPRGLYREMLTRAWSLGGYLPNDHEQIKRLVNASDAEWKRCWPLIEANWKQDGSKIYNPTQREVMMDSLTLREKRALAGAKGGRASGKKRSKPQANEPSVSVSVSGEGSDAEKERQRHPVSGEAVARRRGARPLRGVASEVEANGCREAARQGTARGGLLGTRLLRRHRRDARHPSQPGRERPSQEVPRAGHRTPRHEHRSVHRGVGGQG